MGLKEVLESLRRLYGSLRGSRVIEEVLWVLMRFSWSLRYSGVPQVVLLVVEVLRVFKVLEVGGYLSGSLGDPLSSPGTIRTIPPSGFHTQQQQQQDGQCVFL